MSSSTVNSPELLSVAKKAAREAGRQARQMFSEPRQVSSKGPRDVVTDADLAAQQTITEAIYAAFPEHGFLAEEDDETLPSDGPILWLIDPIDGTVNYSRGIPLFCVSIAAVRNEPPLGVDDVLAAVVYDPMLDETFTATAHGPALLEKGGLQGRPLRTSSARWINEAVIGVDWALDEGQRDKGMAFTARVAQEAFVLRSLGTATLAMAWVAAGRMDAYLNYQLRAWDVAASALLVKQAGGRIADVTGQPLQFDRGHLTCLMCNDHLLEQLVAAAV
jgi:myo-inositol-1(or 4)-monophosphatase